MRIGCLIPDRGDRPHFLSHAKYLLGLQSRQPDVVHIVNHRPKSAAVDLIERCREGLNMLFNIQKCDLVFFIENDDWYAVDYLDKMSRYWELYKRPDLIGIGYTHYYHLELKRYKLLKHEGRASLFNTAISKDAKFEFPPNDTRFFDLHLWKHLKGVTVNPEIISLGIKHNIGLCGGKGHATTFYTDKNSFDDSDMSFLNSHVDSKSFDFYKLVYQKAEAA